MFAPQALASRPRLSHIGEDDDVLVVGIDFGTTYSGVAWATIADFESDQIQLITSWPGTGREEGKAPTELFYEDDQIFWGYEIPPDADPVKWFKLLLVNDEDLAPELRTSEFLLRARKMLREEGKTPVDFISDYLRLLWTHVLETIGKARGASVVDALQFHVVITVPAIWKGYARQSMEQAARKSGILDRRAAGPTTLSFAPEPEAAALSTLCEPGRRSTPGEVYIICDAGGGTVDLVSYKIEGIEPIKMAEAVEGTGGLCGGIFVDEAFERMCKSRLGRKWDRLSKAGIKDIMNGEWESAIKPQFKASAGDNKEYIVRIPAEVFAKASLDDTSREPVIKNGRIHFKSSHIEKAFTDPFVDIDKLIQGQISKAGDKGLKVTGIILVGGLGSSPHLYEHLNAIHSRNRIQVLQSGGVRPRTAICRGAVFKGFLDGIKDTGRDLSSHGIEGPISVTSTVSRASYGVHYYEFFNSLTHNEKDKTWHDTEKQWVVNDNMKWFLKRGENVSKKDPVRHSYYKLYKKDFGGTFTVDMSQCDDDIPPSRQTSSVHSLCSIKCTLDIPYSSLPDFINPSGERLKKMTYDIEMLPSGASVEFVVYIDNRKQGAENASIRF